MATGLVVASTLVSAAGSVYSGSVQAAAASAQAKQAELSGQMSMLSSRQEAAEMSKEKNKLKAKQVAQQAAGGGSVASGNLVDIQKQTDKAADEDISTVLMKGRWALASAQATASSYSSQASSLFTSGLFNAGSSILGGTMKVGKIEGWKGFQNF